MILPWNVYVIPHRHIRSKVCLHRAFIVLVTARSEMVYGTYNRRVAFVHQNLFSAIVVFLEVVIKDKIVKFSKNCGTWAIKEIGGVKVQIKEF